MQGTTQCIFTESQNNPKQFLQTGYTKSTIDGNVSIDKSAVQIMKEDFYPEPKEICTTLTVGQNPNNNVRTCNPTTEHQLRASTASSCQITDEQLVKLVEYCKLPPTQ